MLQTIIRHLCSFGRFKQALEVSEFMREEMRYGISVGDMAVRLDLILKVHGKHDKLDVLVQEMKEKGIKHNAFTNNVQLNAYASSSDIEGMEKFLTTIENNVEVSVDWHAYVAAASAYLKARLAEKALEMLSRAE
ncbi:hypothetical protein PVK06_044474 [Gossypium arboreum]|uniref:Pentatricopeptide repeat-containing protein n=1 Tax=Gossypium arboreum TaxID=29729 RepID=A0ABR0MRE0_GOSAR|nr:hypothetical protein PVK06_044474 [Gossypium arboreum]